MQIFISINQQKLYLYSDGELIADAPVATGVPTHPTPMGVFSVIAKDRFHHSNIYSNAPMPFMQRITWSGIALHEGEGVGRRASHGCIRMPHDFAARLWMFTKLGARVVIARNALAPTAFADPHLFVHKDIPLADPVAAAPPAVKTAQSIDGSKATDAGGAAAASVAAVPAAPSADPAAVQHSAGTGTAGGHDPAPKLVPVKDSTTVGATASPPSVIPAVAGAPEMNQMRGSETDTATPGESLPLPPPRPPSLVEAAAATHAPIAIFVSRKTQRIYVRQHFAPLFDAPITIAHPEQPLGTYLFTAMQYQDDGKSFRWNVVALPDDEPKAIRGFVDHGKGERYAGRRKGILREPVAAPQPVESADDALARIGVPQDVADQISELMVPGSSLVVSDQGLGPETGAGTDFIVIAR